jgi:hypothetical protein
MYFVQIIKKSGTVGWNDSELLLVSTVDVEDDD